MYFLKILRFSFLCCISKLVILRFYYIHTNFFLSSFYLWLSVQWIIFWFSAWSPYLSNSQFCIYSSFLLNSFIIRFWLSFSYVMLFLIIDSFSKSNPWSDLILKIIWEKLFMFKRLLTISGWFSSMSTSLRIKTKNLILRSDHWLELCVSKHITSSFVKDTYYADNFFFHWQKN